MIRVILIGFSLLLAAAAGWAVKIYLSSQREELVAMKAALQPKVVVAPGVEVLVVRDAVQIAGVLSSGNLRWQMWPEEGVNARYITRKARPDAIDKFTGAAARQPLFVGEPLTEEKLVLKRDGSFLAATLAEGGRAVTVKVDEASGVSGLILPGDRVDVLLTHEVASREDDGKGGVVMGKRYVSEVIARDLRVVAIDQEIRHDDKAAPKVGKTVTLAVDAVQAEAISLGRVMGSISLSLRSAFGGESNTVRQRGFTSSTDISAALGERAASAARTPETVTYNVTVYHGLTPQQVRVNRDGRPPAGPAE